MLERWQDRTAYRIRLFWGAFLVVGFLITSAYVAWSCSDLSVGTMVFMIGSSALLAVIGAGLCTSG